MKPYNILMSLLLYDSEAWIIGKVMERRIEPLEMWLYRRMLKIPWVNHISYEEVVQRADAKKEIMTRIRQRQLRLLGHTKTEQQLESLYLTGKFERKRGRENPKIKFVGGVARSCVVVACRRRRCCG